MWIISNLENLRTSDYFSKRFVNGRGSSFESSLKKQTQQKQIAFSRNLSKSKESGVSQVALGIKNLPANPGEVKDTGSIPGLGRSPKGWLGNPLQYSCLEKSHGQRSLLGYNPWGCTELDMTEATQHTRKEIVWQVGRVGEITMIVKGCKYMHLKVFYRDTLYQIKWCSLLADSQKATQQSEKMDLHKLSTNFA